MIFGISFTVLALLLANTAIITLSSVVLLHSIEIKKLKKQIKDQKK